MKINFSISEKKINVLVIDENQYVLENAIYNVNQKSMFRFINYQYSGLLLQGSDVSFSNEKDLNNLHFIEELKNNFPKSTFKKTTPFENTSEFFSSITLSQNFFQSIHEIQSKKSLLIEVNKDNELKKNGISITFFDKKKVVFSDNKIKNASTHLHSEDVKEVILESLNKNNIKIDDIEIAFITSNSDKSPKTPVKKALLELLIKDIPVRTFGKLNLKKKKGNKKGEITLDDYKTFKIKEAFNKHLDSLSEEISKKENNVLFVDGGHANDMSASSFVLSHNGVVSAESFVYKNNQCYEEIAFLSGLKKVLNSDVLSKNKTHVICDGDVIEETLNRLNNISVFSGNSDKLEKSPLFKEVKELYQKQKEKIYVHYVKSHSNSTNILYFGNNLVDKINTNTLKSFKTGHNKTEPVPIIEIEDVSAKSLKKVHVGKNYSSFFNEFAYKYLNIKDINDIKCNYGYEENTKAFLIINKDDKRNFTMNVYNAETKEIFSKIISNYSNFPNKVKGLMENGNISILSNHLIWDQFKSSLNLESKKLIADTKDISINLFHHQQINDMVTKLYKFEKKGIHKNQREEAFNNYVLKPLKNNDFSKIGQNIDKDVIQDIVQEFKSIEKQKDNGLGIKFDFEKTYGNKELFPKGHQVEKDKTYLIMKFGNKNVEIHRIENGNHDVDVYPQDFNHIEHLNNHLTNNPIDNNKPLVLSLPNSTTQKEIADTFRGQSFTHCNHVYNIVRNIKKENLFLTKTLDFSFQLIEKDVKWYNNVLEKSREIKPERKSRNKLK